MCEEINVSVAGNFKSALDAASIKNGENLAAYEAKHKVLVINDEDLARKKSVKGAVLPERE